jgi:hypothetical protein
LSAASQIDHAAGDRPVRYWDESAIFLNAYCECGRRIPADALGTAAGYDAAFYCLCGTLVVRLLAPGKCVLAREAAQ